MFSKRLIIFIFTINMIFSMQPDCSKEHKLCKITSDNCWETYSKCLRIDEIEPNSDERYRTNFVCLENLKSCLDPESCLKSQAKCYYKSKDYAKEIKKIQKMLEHCNQELSKHEKNCKQIYYDLNSCYEINLDRYEKTAFLAGTSVLVSLFYNLPLFKKDFSLAMLKSKKILRSSPFLFLAPCLINGYYNIKAGKQFLAMNSDFRRHILEVKYKQEMNYLKDREDALLAYKNYLGETIRIRDLCDRQYNQILNSIRKIGHFRKS